MAWRNVHRNRGRTLITVSAASLSIAVLIMVYGLIEGMTAQMVRNVTRVSVGDAQAHAVDYRASFDFYEAIEASDAIVELAAEAGFHAAPRKFGGGLVAVDTRASGAQFWGVQPEAELTAFEFPHVLTAGRFLQDKRSDSSKPEVVLGSRLAKSLGAAVGDELTALVQAADGSVGSELFNIVGVLGVVGDALDRSTALIHAEDFDALFLAEGKVHQIAMRKQAEASTEVEDLLATLSGRFPDLEFLDWKGLNPLLWQMLQSSEASTWMMSAVFLLAAGLGVLNTMVMATHDRVREYGVLKALGTPASRILLTILTEAVILSLMAALAGGTLGVVGSQWLATTGIDLSAIEGNMRMGGLVFDPVWRSAFSWTHVVDSIIATSIICALSAIYPGLKAARLRPVEAMTHH